MPAGFGCLLWRTLGKTERSPPIRDSGAMELHGQLEKVGLESEHCVSMMLEFHEERLVLRHRKVRKRILGCFTLQWFNVRFQKEEMRIQIRIGSPCASPLRGLSAVPALGFRLSSIPLSARASTGESRTCRPTRLGRHQ
jgi:hypothetical protein